MSDEENNNTSQSFSSSEAVTSGLFIDDYSHLRLSYHRNFDDTLEISDSSSESESDVESEDVDDEEVEKNRIREYWLSQMPDLPHPAVTMAGIISSASRKMGMVQLNYDNKIEVGTYTQKYQKNLSHGEDQGISNYGIDQGNCISTNDQGNQDSGIEQGNCGQSFKDWSSQGQGERFSPNGRSTLNCKKLP